MARSFFSVMKNVSKMVEKYQCDEDAVSLYNELVSLVEACPFSNSVNTRFICRNWRKSHLEMAEEWNAMNGTEKTVSTFIRQTTVISRSLYEVFPTFGEYMFATENANDLGVLEDRYALRLSFLAFKPELLAGKGVVLSDLNMLKIAGNSSVTFNLDECTTEIALLKPYLKDSAVAYLGQGNAEKISYLLNVLSKPVFTTKSGVNHEKLKLLAKLGQLVVSFVDSKPVIKSEEATVEKRYRFGINTEMENIIYKLSSSLSKADIDEYSSLSAEKQSELNNRVAQYLSMLTPEGLYAILSKLNGVALTEALYGNYDLVGNGIDTTSLSKQEKSFIL